MAVFSRAVMAKSEKQAPESQTVSYISCILWRSHWQILKSTSKNWTADSTGSTQEKRANCCTLSPPVCGIWWLSNEPVDSLGCACFAVHVQRWQIVLTAQEKTETFPVLELVALWFVVELNQAESHTHIGKQRKPMNWFSCGYIPHGHVHMIRTVMMM